MFDRQRIVAPQLCPTTPLRAHFLDEYLNSGSCNGEMKLKKKRAIKFVALSFIVSVFHFNSISALADTTVAGDAKIPPPQNVDEIVKNIRAIIDHGDLADEQFYAEKLGLVMLGGEIGPVLEPDFACGPGMASKRKRVIEQRFYYKNVPSYFSPRFGRNPVCDHPYAKAFLSNGLIEVVGSIMIDANKMCITEDDFRGYFKSGEYSNERGGFRVKYSVATGNVISLDVASPSSKPQCAVYIDLYQNRI